MPSTLSAAPPRPTPRVVVGIVNWNCGDYLEGCLRSVVAQTLAPAEVLLVDNASTDGSTERIEALFPSVRVLRQGENRGFGAGHNAAIRACSCDYYLPLNPDVVLGPNFIETLVAALQAHPECGSATGLLYFAAKDPQGRRVVHSTGHLLLRHGYAYNRLYRVPLEPDALTEGEVGGACGACPLYRRAMLEDVAVGGEYFDEMFFLYYEDVDLDWRARQAGWRCWFTPKAIASHVVEGTGGARRADIRARFLVNRWLMLLKNAPWRLLARMLPFIVKFDLRWSLPRMVDRPAALPWMLRFLPGGLWRAWRRRRLVAARRRIAPAEEWDYMQRNRAEFHASEALARRVGKVRRKLL